MRDLPPVGMEWPRMSIMRKVFKLVTLFMGEVDLTIRGKLAHDVLDLSGPLFLQKLVPKIEGHWYWNTNNRKPNSLTWKQKENDFWQLLAVVWVNQWFFLVFFVFVFVLIFYKVWQKVSNSVLKTCIKLYLLCWW